MGITFTMLPAGLFQGNRDVSKGMGDTAVSQIVGIVTKTLMFSILIADGFFYRNLKFIKEGCFWLPSCCFGQHVFVVGITSLLSQDLISNLPVVLPDSLILLSWIAEK